MAKGLKRDLPVLDRLQAALDALRSDADGVGLLAIYTGLGKAALDKALRAGPNPILRVADLPGATRGRFLTALAGSITIDAGLVKAWQARPDDAAMADKVISTVLHEMVHWGRHKAGLPAHLCAAASLDAPCTVPACRQTCWREAGHAFEAELARLWQIEEPTAGDDCEFDGDALTG